MYHQWYHCEYSLYHQAQDESISTLQNLNRFICLRWNITKSEARHPASPTYTNSLLPPDHICINHNNGMKTTAYWHRERKRESLWEWKTCMWGGQERLQMGDALVCLAVFLCWQSWVIRGKSPLKENIQRVINGFNKGAVYPFNRDKSSPSFWCADKTRHTDISFISPALDLKRSPCPFLCWLCVFLFFTVIS